MLTSISPLGERARGARWGRTAAAYVVTSVLAGAALGAALGAVGSVLTPGRWSLAVLAALAIVAVGLDAAGRVPTVRRQVDETWLVTYRDWVYGAGFGLQLGAGAATVVTSAATYLTWAVELAGGSAGLGAVVGGVFGLARGAMLLLSAGVDDPVALRRRHARLVAALPVARAAAVVTQVAAGAGFVAAAGMGVR